MTTIHDEEINNWSEKFRTKQIHLVCVASGGLTTCDTAASSIGGMDQRDEVWPLTYEVNKKGETGTFYPKLTLTVLPLLEWKERSKPIDSDEFLTRSFQDVAKANREYIKLSTLYIDLNGWGYDYPFDRARQIAEKVLVAEPSIETIYFAPKAK